MLNVIGCKTFKLNIDSFILEEGELFSDVIKDVLLQDQTARSLIFAGNLSNSKINLFRFKQSLNDPTLLFWRPFSVKNEFPFIFFLKLSEGKLLPNTEFGDSA